MPGGRRHSHRHHARQHQFRCEDEATGPDAYSQYKVRLGRALLLGLELLVAADIIRTVALEPTLPNVTILAVLVVVRTFLSWSLVVEMEGHWPWKGGARAASD
jgi:uncharacterized membrane protein